MSRIEAVLLSLSPSFGEQVLASIGRWDRNNRSIYQQSAWN